MLFHIVITTIVAIAWVCIFASTIWVGTQLGELVNMFHLTGWPAYGIWLLYVLILALVIVVGAYSIKIFMDWN